MTQARDDMPNDRNVILDKIHGVATQRAETLLRNIGCKTCYQLDFAPNGLRYFDHIVFICAMNQDIRITFRIHALYEQGLAFWSLGQKKSRMGATRSRIIDALKEFCNTVTGRLRETMAKNAMELGQSLPVYVSGFNELFFASLFDPKFSRSTKIVTEHFELILSTSVELMSNKVNPALMNISPGTGDDEDTSIEIF